ncbi:MULTISPECIES: ABC transporter substrate-binding protein [Rhodococcus]|jgi:peptide/nickel transport system substrate-binding protein|nr:MULTISPECIES: ABC transporter substrate-binding protein [Rhodococcus]MCD2153810.1 ABC transporter substrate-binding protein [Rhodococcus cerastii]MCQ4124493.1 ABC transporter substrate-binding protein [Rhodococcus erythropolis]MCS4252704.1 peptide/nickel transport system substrate-binding protein [Rhodococcus erythropolis]MCW2428854.1 peptide/nickel transport system substrate-binding protein [Rhodococcus erythropolis]MDN3458725.1 ABC transporter substrate-binding protein [Rhodococcus sp. AP
MDKTMTRFSRRTALIGTATALALVLGGCSGAAKDAGASSEPAGEPQRGGELRVSIGAEPIAPAFDMGTMAVTSVGTASIATLAYNGLVDFQDGQAVPELATSWKQTSPTQYVFALRDGVKFTDGTPFDAEAVKFNLDRLLDPNGTGANLPPSLESVEVSAPNEVTMNLSTPAGGFVASLRRGRVMMMSPTAVTQYAKTDPFKASVGTGPYKFEEYKTGQYIRLVRNDDYWADDNYLDSIKISILPDPTTSMQAFVNGELDVLGVTPAQLAQVKSRGNSVIKTSISNTFNYVSFNQAVKPFDNVDVRRGFSAAINRDGIAQGIYQGYADPASGPLSPKIGDAYSDLSGLASQTFSTDKAKEFLKNGNFDFGTTVPFSTFTQAPFSTEADAVAEQLQNVGVKVDLSKEEFGSWAQKIYTAKNFTVMNSGQTTATVDPDEILYPLFHSKGDLNASSINDPELDKLLDAARAEQDPQQRAQMYQQASKLIADNAYAAFTVYPQKIAATSPSVGGYEFTEGGTNPLSRVWLAK